MQRIDEFSEFWAYGDKAPSLFVRIAELWSEMESAVAEVARRGFSKAEPLQRYFNRRSMPLLFHALVLASQLGPDREEDMAQIISQWSDVMDDLLKSNGGLSEAPANFLMGLPGWVNQYLQYFAGVSYERRFEMVSESVRQVQKRVEWLAKSRQEKELASDFEYNVAA